MDAASGNLKVGAGVSTRKQANSEVDHLLEVSQRLATRTAVIEQRLNERLEAVRAVYDLTPRALLSSHRQLRELGVLGTDPSPTEFWDVTANPLAQAMVEAASRVIDDEISIFEDAVDRFRRSLTTLVMTTGDDCRPAAAEVLQQCIDQMVSCGLDRDPINELGAQWQLRLRRAASRSLFPKLMLVSTHNSEPLIAVAEMALLDTSPWAHDDRLLSAFELAHADVRQHLRDRLGQMSVVVTHRTSRKLQATS